MAASGTAALRESRCSGPTVPLAVQELEAAGTFEDLTAIGPPQDDIDRALAQFGAGNTVDADLARLKAELSPAPAPPHVMGPADGRLEA